MTDQEFTLWLLVIFVGCLVLLGLVVLHDRANPRRTPLNEVLMRNGADDE